MRNHKFFLLLIVGYYGCAAAGEQLDRVGNKKLPDGAVLMCGQHVVGKSMHIDWQAFGLNEDIDKTRQFYQAQFGQPPARDDAQGYAWTFKHTNSELIYSVQYSSTAGPWSNCSAQPFKFKTIVLISNGIWVDPP
jgi:hypothetical protein